MPPAVQAPVLSFLAAEFRERCRPTVTIDRLALFHQADGRFRIVESVPFG
ncbi:MAG: hypothetical protein WDM84_03255 [Bauldia sp.]